MLTATQESFKLIRKIRTRDGYGGWTEADQDLGYVRGTISPQEYKDNPMLAERLAGRPYYRGAVKLAPSLVVGDILQDRRGNRYVVVDAARAKDLQLVDLAGV